MTDSSETSENLILSVKGISPLKIVPNYRESSQDVYTRYNLPRKMNPSDQKWLKTVSQNVNKQWSYHPLRFGDKW